MPIRITGSGYFATTLAGLSDPSSCYHAGDDYSVPANTGQYLYLPNETFNIFVGKKYNILNLELTANNAPTKTLSMNVEDLKFSTLLQGLSTGALSYGDCSYLSSFTNLISISISVSKVYGTLDLHLSPNLSVVNILSPSIGGDLANFGGANVTRLNIASSAIYGTFDSLGSAKKMTAFYPPSNISGTIEGFVNGQVTGTGARTSYTATTPNCPSLDKVTFGGSYQEPLDINFINWDYTSSNEKIYIHNGVGGVANATKVYRKGYTQEEAEAAFSGKTIVRVDA
jgi:hypothetical protein